jgi:hypothetical protein
MLTLILRRSEEFGFGPVRAPINQLHCVALVSLRPRTEARPKTRAMDRQGEARVLGLHVDARYSRCHLHAETWS